MKSASCTVLPDAPGTIAIEEATTPIQRTVLPCGVRVLTQRVETSPSVAITAWIPVGARDEASGHEGSTHYLEHLLFKGTPSRDAAEIARAFDRVGGESNATTTKEYTNYYAVVLKEDARMATSVLLDMVTSPLLDASDFATERGVIINELRLAQDDPADVAHETFARRLFGDTQALAKPTGGTVEQVEATTLEAVREHHRQWYSPRTLVVTAAGNVDHDAFVDHVSACLREGGWDLSDGTILRPDRAPTRGHVTEGRVHLKKPVELGYLLVGMPAVSVHDPGRFALSTLTHILGGGMSSRLFQEIREKRGLAYTTYAYPAAYSDAGYVAMYAGCELDHVDEVEARMIDELADLAEHGPTQRELDDAFGQLRGSFALGLDDNRVRSSRLGSAEITRGAYTSVADHLAAMRSVSAEDVRAMAHKLINEPRTSVVVGPDRDLDR